MAGEEEKGGPGAEGYVRRVLVTVGILLGVLVVVAFVWFGIELLFVLFAGILLAVFYRGLAAFLSRYFRLPAWLAVTIVVVGLYALVGLLAWLFAPSLSQQMTELGQRLPAAMKHLEEGFRGGAVGAWISEHFATASKSVSGGGLLGGILGVFRTTLGVVVDAVIIFFLGLYFAYAPHRYLEGLVRLVPPARRLRAREVLATMAHQLRWWLVGRFSAMGLVAVLTIVGLLVVRLPLALLLGVVAGLLTFVPIVGPIVSAVPAVLIGLLESPRMALSVIFVYLAVHILEGYFITPLIQQRAVHLPPVLIIMAQAILGFAVGVLGIALATPLTVAVVVLVNMLYVQDVLGDPVEVR